MAAATDLFQLGTNNFATTLSTSITSSTLSLPLTSTTNLSTSTGITLVIDRVNSTGSPTPALTEYVTGVISGGDLVLPSTAYRGMGDSTAQAHLSGAIVEAVWDMTQQNNLMNGILVEHLQSGQHGAINPSTVTASGLITANGGVTGTTMTASGLITANDGLTVSSGAVNVPSGTFNKLFNTQSATVTSANASTLVSWNAWGGTYSVACVAGRKYNIRVVEPSVSFDNTVSNPGSNYNVNLLINGGVYTYQQSPLFVVANDGYGVNIFDFWWSATSTATVDFSFQFNSSGASGTYTWSRSSTAFAYLIINEFA